MNAPCEVHKYSIDRLLEIFAEKSSSSIYEVKKKLHAVYFHDYFGCIDAQTVVVENEYVDRDYLEDYSEYYVRCFQEYPRKCTRLHFFKNDFTFSIFEKCLLGNEDILTPTQLQENYLGFIVVKPLPRTIIGRTCLITYPQEDRRYFPATRCYVVNLFGLRLRVEHTLAFQEQDSVVAACATSALWSIFQATGHLFQHQIPSPATITNNATRMLTTEQRAFPSAGLTPLQMAHAIKSIGLEPFVVNVSNHFSLMTTAYAYLRAGIPMMLGFQLVDVSNPNSSYVLGQHAVAITGYSFGRVAPEALDGTDFILRATRIDKIYVHDDQVGPFSRMVFDGKALSLSGKQIPSILTSWRGDDEVIGSRRAIPYILLIPVYHKIRIPFSAIQDVVYNFDQVLRVLKVTTDGADSCPQLFEWDIFLVSVNTLKEQIQLGEIAEGARRDLLFQSLPRFLWQASLLLNSCVKLDLLFDATDIEKGEFFLRVIEHDISFVERLRLLFRLDGIRENFETTPAWPIIEWFRL
jgi:hypothetical protein